MTIPYIFFNNLHKPIKTSIYARKKYPFTSYAAAKHPKHNKLAIANLGFFAKVSVAVGSIIPWITQGIIDFTATEP